jgi:hypothetical protein
LQRGAQLEEALGKSELMNQWGDFEINDGRLNLLNEELNFDKSPVLEKKKSLD